MLGKLARRLRMLGYDTEYSKEAGDEELLKRAREENRILLTRDTFLSETKSIKTLLIKNKEEFEDQVRQVIKELGLTIDQNLLFTRCMECNTPLENIAKEKIKDKVASFIFEAFDKFAFCPRCQRVYWKGSHFEKMLKEIEGYSAF